MCDSSARLPENLKPTLAPNFLGHVIEESTPGGLHSEDYVTSLEKEVNRLRSVVKNQITIKKVSPNAAVVITSPTSPESSNPKEPPQTVKIITQPASAASASVASSPKDKQKAELKEAAKSVEKI